MQMHGKECSHGTRPCFRCSKSRIQPRYPRSAFRGLPDQSKLWVKESVPQPTLAHLNYDVAQYFWPITLNSYYCTQALTRLNVSGSNVSGNTCRCYRLVLLWRYLYTSFHRRDRSPCYMNTWNYRLYLCIDDRNIADIHRHLQTQSNADNNHVTSCSISSNSEKTVSPKLIIYAVCSFVYTHVDGRHIIIIIMFIMSWQTATEQ